MKVKGLDINITYKVFDIIKKANFKPYIGYKVDIDEGGYVKVKIGHHKYKGVFNELEFKVFIDKVVEDHKVSTKHPNHLVGRPYGLKILKNNGINVDKLDSLRLGGHDITEFESKHTFFIKNSGNITADFNFMNIIGGKKLFYTLEITKEGNNEYITRINIDNIV